jgi:hypothetical protein
MDTRGTQRSTPVHLSGELECPFCHNIAKAGWDSRGRLMYWSVKNYCVHFKGVYSAFFRDWVLWEGNEEQEAR